MTVQALIQKFIKECGYYTEFNFKISFQRMLLHQPNLKWVLLRKIMSACGAKQIQHVTARVSGDCLRLLKFDNLCSLD